jgi:hypothetical protein
MSNTVTVKSIQWHTYHGKTYDVGATYEIDEQYADSVVVQGKAVRVDKGPAAPARSVSDTTVKPMSK